MPDSTPLQLHKINYSLPDNRKLFTDLSISFASIKTGLVGRNGVGKSTLMKIINQECLPISGSIHCNVVLDYVPQSPQFPEHATVATVLDYAEKLAAYHRIVEGSTSENDFSILNESWDIEQQITYQLSMFSLEYLSPQYRVSELSSGELTRLLLTRIFHSNAQMILLDEPTNHLDIDARMQFYRAVKDWTQGLIIISHDRALLNLMDEIVELTSLGAFHYGGNYDAYVEQKSLEQAGLELALSDAKKQLQKAKNSIQESREKHTSKRAQGQKLRKSGSINKLEANAARGKSERTQGRMLTKEIRMTKEAEQQLKTAREKIEILEEIVVDLPHTKVPHGKTMVKIENLTFAYPNTEKNIIQNFNLALQGPERIALSGKNGSGKTTLIRLLLGNLATQTEIYLGTSFISYLDQKASVLCQKQSILENFKRLNPKVTEEQAYTNLARFLFRNVAALKLVKDLSGGETLRAALACTLMSAQPPQLLILDEPTNHLDLHSIREIESALKNYQGSMIVISHDKLFLEQIGIERIYSAPFGIF